MNRRVYLAALLTCLLFSNLGMAQTATQPSTNHQQTFVKGTEHPEQIPDEAAAAAVFSMHSQAQDSAKHQLKIGLSEPDRAVYSAALETYGRARSAKARVGAPTLLKNLERDLSPDGYQKLMAFIRSEKRFMQFAKGNGGELQ